MQRVMGCVTTVSYSFLINGATCGTIKPSRGLRQGNPMSLYLYLLVAKRLSNLIRDVVDQGNYKGFHCSRMGPMISHLFFCR